MSLKPSSLIFILLLALTSLLSLASHPYSLEVYYLEDMPTIIAKNYNRETGALVEELRPLINMNLATYSSFLGGIVQ